MATTAEKAAELKRLGVSSSEINKAINQSNLQKAGLASGGNNSSNKTTNNTTNNTITSSSNNQTNQTNKTNSSSGNSYSNNSNNNSNNSSKNYNSSEEYNSGGVKGTTYYKDNGDYWTEVMNNGKAEVIGKMVKGVGTGIYESRTYKSSDTSSSSNNSNQTSQSNNNLVNTNDITKYWNNLSYEEQQKYANDSNVKASLAAKGLTFKTKGTTDNTDTIDNKGNVITNGDGWDYQDNSDARMQEIKYNLEKDYTSTPYLFSDYNTFAEHYINGKGRTQEQIDTINSWWNAKKGWNKFVAMTPEQLGTALANGTTGAEGYLDYLAYNDRETYNQVLQYKAAAEDKIGNQGINDSNDYMNGLTGIDALAAKFGYTDKDGDGQYDNIYDTSKDEEWTAEEEELRTLNEEYLSLAKQKRQVLDDLIEQHPGVALSTLQVIAADMTSDLDDQIYDLSIKMNTQSSIISSKQEEQQLKNSAQQQMINDMKNIYGMYYSYTSEGMSELAQAQYAASNITLDQADSGTYTQKQMALQSVLDGYYEKYGSIIQRSESQVINDVIEYANKNGVSLSKALQENFITPLQSKPQYATLSTGGSLSSDKWTKLSDTQLYNQVTGEIKNVDGSISNTPSSSNKATINPISSEANIQTTNNLKSSYPDGSIYKNGQCGELMNLDASTSGSNIHFGSELSDKTKWKNSDIPSVGEYVIFDWTNYPGANEDMKKYGHVAKITGIDSNGDLIIRDANRYSSEPGKIYEHKLDSSYNKYIYGYVDPTKTETYGYGESPLDYAFTGIARSGNLTADQKKEFSFDTAAYLKMYELASSGDIDHLLNSPDGQKFAANYKAAQFSDDASYTESAILSALKNGITDQRVLGIIDDLMGIIEKKLRWTSGAAISGSEWNSNASILLPYPGESYSTSLRKFQTFEKGYLKKSFDNLNDFAGTNYTYIPLFEEGSKYFVKSGTTSKTNIQNSTIDSLTQ